MVSTPLTSNGAREGIGYVLPYTQWKVTVAWRLDYCPDPRQPAANGGRDATLVVKVDAVADSADDGSLQFLINPQDLQTATSITTFGAKWHDGRNILSSINASVEDRTAQVVGNLVKTAVKVIPLAAGAPAPPGAAPTATLFCTAEATAALSAAKDAKALLDIKDGDLKKATSALASVTTKVASMGGAIDDATKSALSTAIDNLVKAQREQSATAEALQTALEAISYTRKLNWPSESSEFSSGPISADIAKINAWFQGAAGDEVPLDTVYFQIERIGSFGRLPDRLDKRKPISPNTALAPDPSNPTVETKGEDKYLPPDDKSRGLRYRMPARGRLVVCSRSPCGSDDDVGMLAEFEGPVAQLGYVNVLPFRSRAFGSNSFTAEMNLDGSLKSVGYEQKAAPAEAATGALADAATQLSSVLDPTARLQADTAYLKALKDKRDALELLKTPEIDAAAKETSDLDAETTLLNARLNRLKAEIALEELRATQTQ